MADFVILKETAVPSQLTPNSVILVAPPGKPGYMEIYVVDNAGTATRKVMDDTRVQAMIDAAVASAASGLTVVATIAARNALTPNKAIEVLVTDATGDPSVGSGWARYVWMVSTSTWLKLAEGESQDLILSWAALQNKPTSTVAAIDDAVNKRHSHTNITQLNKITEDGEGKLLYNGARPKQDWSSTGW